MKLYKYVNNVMHKPLVVYRFSGNVMKLRLFISRIWQNLFFLRQKYDFKITLMSYDKIESNICAPVLLIYETRFKKEI